jgi:hypothetical protein
METLDAEIFNDLMKRDKLTYRARCQLLPVLAVTVYNKRLVDAMRSGFLVMYIK